MSKVIFFTIAWVLIQVCFLGRTLTECFQVNTLLIGCLAAGVYVFVVQVNGSKSVSRLQLDRKQARSRFFMAAERNLEDIDEMTQAGDYGAATDGNDNWVYYMPDHEYYKSEGKED